MTNRDDKANILIVDDRPEKLLAFESVLEELNENVITAQSGYQALRWLLENDAAVILLDVNMPEIDGFETAELIRNRQKSAHIPIIFVTAYVDEVHATRGYALGAVDYISSPIVPEILRSKVKVFVQLFHLTQQIRRQADERIAFAREQAARVVAEESTQRANFLAEASKVMSSSLNIEDILEGATKLVVPFLADLSLLTLVDENGRPYRSQFAWMADSGLRTASAGAVQDVALARTMQKAIAGGCMRSCFELKTDDTRLAVRSLDENKDDFVDIGFLLQQAVVYPLNARGRTRGVLFLGLGPFRTRFGITELALAEDIATRAAIGLDNCLLYQAIQRADERKNEFLAMLAHELRNPLAPIRHAVEVMGAVSSDMEMQNWARGIIDRQSQQLVRLLDDLLDVSRVTRGKIHLQVELIDVSEAIAAAVESSCPLIETRGHILSVKQPSAPIWVTADFVRLTQIISNLLNNAAKFTEHNGQIWLEVHADNDEVVFRVRDSGIGIQQDMLNTIFELFTQENKTLDRAHGGLGIGLTVVRRLVELHKGTVQAFSEGPGKGSEFVVRLPMRLTTLSSQVATDNGCR
jgi:signal transduction histidine kinase